MSKIINNCFKCIGLVILFQWQLCLIKIHAQPQCSDYVKQWYQTGRHMPNSFIELADSGFIIIGQSAPSMTGNTYPYAMRIDKCGDSIWTKQYPYYGILVSISKESDSVFVMSRQKLCQNCYSHIVQKINLNGDVIFYAEIDGLTGGWISRMNRCSDGGYVMSGYNSGNYGHYKTDSNFNVQWHDYNYMNYWASEIIEDKDGGYVAIGCNGYSPWPYTVSKLDSNGNLVWIYDYGNNNDFNNLFYPSKVLIMPDSNYLIANRGFWDFQLFKVNHLTGAIMWTRLLNYMDTLGSTHPMSIHHLAEFGPSNYIGIGGGMIAMFNNNGDTLWTHFDPFRFGAAQVKRTLDGGIARCGYLQVATPGQGYTSYPLMFIKSDSIGNTVYTSVIDVENSFSPMLFYPNPATSTIGISTVSLQNERDLQFMLMDVNGRIVINQSYKAGEEIDVSTLSSGIYFGEVRGKEKVVRGKVIVHH